MRKWVLVLWLGVVMIGCTARRDCYRPTEGEMCRFQHGWADCVQMPVKGCHSCVWVAPLTADDPQSGWHCRPASCPEEPNVQDEDCV